MPALIPFERRERGLVERQRVGGPSGRREDPSQVHSCFRLVRRRVDARPYPDRAPEQRLGLPELLLRQVGHAQRVGALRDEVKLAIDERLLAHGERPPVRLLRFSVALRVAIDLAEAVHRLRGLGIARGQRALLNRQRTRPQRLDEVRPLRGDIEDSEFLEGLGQARITLAERLGLRDRGLEGLLRLAVPLLAERDARIDPTSLPRESGAARDEGSDRDRQCDATDPHVGRARAVTAAPATLARGSRAARTAGPSAAASPRGAPPARDGAADRPASRSSSTSAPAPPAVNSFGTSFRRASGTSPRPTSQRPVCASEILHEPPSRARRARATIAPNAISRDLRFGPIFFLVSPRNPHFLRVCRDYGLVRSPLKMKMWAKLLPMCPDRTRCNLTMQCSGRAMRAADCAVRSLYR